MKTLVDELTNLRRRVERLERTTKMFPSSLPPYLLGTTLDWGFTGSDSTIWDTVMRNDAYISASKLNYDVQVSNQWQSSPGSVDWRISIRSLGVWYELVSGTGTVNDQFSGVVDITAVAGVDALYRHSRIDLQIRRVGGAGEVAVRLTRPLVLQIGDSIA